MHLRALDQLVRMDLVTCLSILLTPANHFLFGQAPAVTAQSSADSSYSMQKHWWRRVQEFVEYVWKRWISRMADSTEFPEKVEVASDN